MNARTYTLAGRLSPALSLVLSPVLVLALALALAVTVTVTTAATLSGCTDTVQGEEPVALGDEAAFAALVQPYVGLRCGSLDCHGDSGRPLRLFAEHGLRARDELRGQPVEVQEIAGNVAAFAGIDPEHRAGSDASGHLALTKGLAVAAGGFAHKGGDVWTAVDEPGYVCVLGWLDGRAGEVAVQDACASAYLEVMPTP